MTTPSAHFGPFPVVWDFWQFENHVLKNFELKIVSAPKTFYIIWKRHKRAFQKWAQIKNRFMGTHAVAQNVEFWGQNGKNFCASKNFKFFFWKTLQWSKSMCVLKFFKIWTIETGSRALFRCTQKLEWKSQNILIDPSSKTSLTLTKPYDPKTPLGVWVQMGHVPSRYWIYHFSLIGHFYGKSSL